MASSHKIIILSLGLLLSSSLMVEGFGFGGQGNSEMGLAAILAAGLITELLEKGHHHHGCHHHHSAASQLHQRIVALRHAVKSHPEQNIAAIRHRLAASQQLQSIDELQKPQLHQRIVLLNHQRVGDVQHQDAVESQLEQRIATLRRQLAATQQLRRTAELQQRIKLD